MVSLSIHRADAPNISGKGIRPINTRTDLPALAHLLEIAFQEKMDAAGRAALQQLRDIGRFGVLHRWFPSSLAEGIRRSLVWVEDGRLLGNISIYAETLPYQKRRAWILANIAVLPGQRNRGIATQLISAALEKLQRKESSLIVLQVDEENATARKLYQSLGFVEENVFGIWLRRRNARIPSGEGQESSLLRSTAARRKLEHQLARQTRANEQGGIAWLRPLADGDFISGVRGHWLQLREGRIRERRLWLANENRVMAALWLDRRFNRPIELTLLHEANPPADVIRTLLSWAIGRYPFRNFILEHPQESALEPVMKDCGFRLARTVVNMHYRES